MTAKKTVGKVVSLRAFRTLRECQKLFKGYESKLKVMEKSDLLSELDRYRVEANRYPSHLLTIVKGEILMGVLKDRSITHDLRTYATNEGARLKGEVERRLYTQ